MAISESPKNPVLHQEKVIVQNKHGETLLGVLHETGSREIVILCHGFRSTKEDCIMVNLAVTLEKEGISVFRFDFAGNGEADDLHAVIQHFREINRVINTILGHRKGGDVVLYASKHHDIDNVINVSGCYDLKRDIEERIGDNFMQRIEKDGFDDVKNKIGSVVFRVTKESLMDWLTTDMHEACLKIEKKCGVLTVHGDADEVIPVEDAMKFHKIIPNRRLQIVGGANHGYTSHQAGLTTIVLNFIKAAVWQWYFESSQRGNQYGIS